MSAVIIIEDCYEIENATDLGEDHDMVEHQLVVFDSKKDPEDGGKTIKEVLAEYPSILQHAVQDSYLYLEFKVVLSIVGDQAEKPRLSMPIMLGKRPADWW